MEVHLENIFSILFICFKPLSHNSQTNFAKSCISLFHVLDSSHLKKPACAVMRLLRSIRFARALRSIRIVRLFRYIGALRTLALSILSTMVGIWGFCFDIKRDLGQVSPNEHTKRIKEKEQTYDPGMCQDLWLVRFLLDRYYLHACMLAESSVYRMLLKITYGLQPLFCRGQ